MAVCRRCGNEYTSLDWLKPFSEPKGRCKNCEKAVQQALIGFRETFLHFSSLGVFTAQEMQYLMDKAAHDRIGLDEALEFIRKDALNLLERVLDAIIDQGPLTDQLEAYFRQLQLMLSVSDTEAHHLLREIMFLNIYRGKFPLVSQKYLQGILLGPNETCFLLISAQYHKVNKTSTKQIPGRLVATNKKLRFLSDSGGFEILWNSVMSIKRYTTTIKRRYGSSEVPFPVYGIFLELSKKTGSGFYAVSDPEIAVAIIDTLARFARGQIQEAHTVTGSSSPRQLQQHIDVREDESERIRNQSEEASRVLLIEPVTTLVADLDTSNSKPQKAIEVLYIYAHEDEKLRNKIEMQLSLLRQQGYITNWHDRKINPGQEWANEIIEHLNTADIILLLVSPAFLASDYCSGIEVKRALERHERGEARVIPVILRKVYWQEAPFGKLQALPTDAKPVTSRGWHNQDEAFFNVAEGIRKIVEEIRNRA